MTKKPPPALPRHFRVANLLLDSVESGVRLSSDKLAAIVAAHDPSAELLAALRDIAPDDECKAIEDNPDEGSWCFFCYGSVIHNRVIEHSQDCAYVAARNLIDRIDREDNA